MQLYRGEKPASSDQITRYKAHVCQRNTKWKNTRSNVFTINLIFFPQQTPRNHSAATAWLWSQMPACKCLSSHVAKENLTSPSWQSGLLPDGERHAPAPGSAALLHIKLVLFARYAESDCKRRCIIPAKENYVKTSPLWRGWWCALARQWSGTVTLARERCWALGTPSRFSARHSSGGFSHGRPSEKFSLWSRFSVPGVAAAQERASIFCVIGCQCWSP